MSRKPRTVEYITKSVRMPATLADAIRDDAAANGRSANEEIVDRLQASRDARLASLEIQLEEVKGMLRKLLDAAG